MYLCDYAYNRCVYRCVYVYSCAGMTEYMHAFGCINMCASLRDDCTLINALFSLILSIAVDEQWRIRGDPGVRANPPLDPI